MDETAVLRLFERCSNAGRWGPDDQLGTLNLIGPEQRINAAREVVEGIVVALGLELGPGAGGGTAVRHQMTDLGRGDSWATLDSVDIAPHGFDITHVDAIGHVLFNGEMYNGRRAIDSVDEAGLGFGSIEALAAGIFTRGVFLDVAAARGLPYLAHGAAIGVDDLLAAERLTGTTVQQGDAIFVRTGLHQREAAEGPSADGSRTGIGAECIPWIHERDIAVYAGDCVDQLPSGYATIVSPLHQVGLVAMGLVMLDNPAVEPLAEACRRLARSTFLLTCGPLPIAGGTGSAVNPLAIF